MSIRKLSHLYEALELLLIPLQSIQSLPHLGFHSRKQKGHSCLGLALVLGCRAPVALGLKLVLESFELAYLKAQLVFRVRIGLLPKYVKR